MDERMSGLMVRVHCVFESGVTLRGNSGNRSGRRARRVSTGVSEDALATDSGVFEAWGRR